MSIIDEKNEHIQSYRYLGLDYFVKINGKNYTLKELTDDQLNKLILLNSTDKREQRHAMSYIFKDVKKNRRIQKLKNIKCLNQAINYDADMVCWTL